MEGMTEPQFIDFERDTINGFIGILIHFFMIIFFIITMGMWGVAWPIALLSSITLGPLVILMFNCYVIVNPNEAVAVQFFGKYAGTTKKEGFGFFVNPFYYKIHVSLRVRNFETVKLKVNDVNANPIDIACVVVWKVFDAAEALFEVDDYDHYVKIQSEAALRGMATTYPYDIIEEKDIGGVSLSSHQELIAVELKDSLKERLQRAGIEVLEARISHLAYASEIAQAMLRRQQASAVVAARREIVNGAVGMVELALEQLTEKEIITFDDDKKATMVSNLLVVLCSEDNTSPIVNAGL